MINIDLPRPISTNSLFANVRGKGRIKSQRYNTWLWHAKAQIQKQKPIAKPNGPVRVLITVGTKGVRKDMDGDNCLKAYLDALVSNGILADDNREIIRGVGMEWVEGKEGATAHITAADGLDTVSLPVAAVIS